MPTLVGALPDKGMTEMHEQTFHDPMETESIGSLVAANAVPRRAAQNAPTRHIRIFDTTLRDGEQSPGASMTHDEKLLVADQLVRLGVDIIEAGFPAASPGDLAAVKAIARMVRGASVAGLARANRDDIDACYEALQDAVDPVLHVFIATSDIHMQYKLRMTPEEVLERVSEMVAYAHSSFAKVEFSAEDATRTDRDFLVKVCAAAIAAGATTINIPDTVGYMMPHEYTSLITHLRASVPGIENVTLSAHCHDDLGLATANSLAAIAAGVGQVECTINGLGERAGNASLEEIAMAMKTRNDNFMNCTTNIVTEQIVAASQLVSRVTGIPVQPNKAVVGTNAFAHEAGIHQDGVLKHRSTYEIMDPRSVGWDDTRLVLGKHSGRHGFDSRLRHLGYRLNREEIQRAYNAFIAHVDEHKTVSDETLHHLAMEAQTPVRERVAAE
jgi:2-isopropylmalate synthase